MLCPKCNTAAQIRGTETKVRNDDTPSEKTEVYLVQEFVCRNGKCGDFGKVIGEAEHRIY